MHVYLRRGNQNACSGIALPTFEDVLLEQLRRAPESVGTGERFDVETLAFLIERWAMACLAAKRCGWSGSLEWAPTVFHEVGSEWHAFLFRDDGDRAYYVTSRERSDLSQLIGEFDDEDLRRGLSRADT